MLHKVEENTDWRSKYQDTLRQLEARELEWEQIEALLRKTIGRLSIAGRGFDERLDKHLFLIQELSRDKRDEKLAGALKKLSTAVAALDDTQTNRKSRRSDPIMLMLELLQNIHFDAAQRDQLKQICSELLISVASGHDRDSISVYIQKLSALINENFDRPARPGRNRQLGDTLAARSDRRVSRSGAEVTGRPDQRAAGLRQPELNNRPGHDRPGHDDPARAACDRAGLERRRAGNPDPSARGYRRRAMARHAQRYRHLDRGLAEEARPGKTRPRRLYRQRYRAAR
jgi:hypothetical protein